MSGDFDPADWEDFRAEAHAMLDFCVDYLRGARGRPVWREMGPEDRAVFDAPVPWEGAPLSALTEMARTRIAPFATGNTSPRFFGWVHGGGTANGMLAEMLAAALNCNCGGRDHVGALVERQVLRWCAEAFGFSPETSGVLTAGCSSATLIALAAARWRILGADTRRSGIGAVGKPLLYASEEVHSAIVKAAELLGHGTDSVRRIPVDAVFRIDLDALNAAIKADKAASGAPFCIVGCAGTVNTGAVDDLDTLAEIAAREGLWLHVDGAFGAWTRLAGPPWAGLTAGMGRAQSLAFDFHKWPSVPYDAGCVLIQDEAAHRGAFHSRPDYLGEGGEALGGGDPWFCEYGVDLSRGFRALKVWMALSEFGLHRIGASVADNCALAARMAARAEAEPDLRLMAPAPLNLCCFRLEPPGVADLDELNRAVVARLQREGRVVFSTTRIRGETCIRAALVNHRTTAADVDLAMEAVLAVGQPQALAGVERP